MRRAIVFLLLVSMMVAPAQQIGQNTGTSRASGPVFSVGTQLVVETVTVTDGQGKPVEGLTAKDFTITEDGVDQPIRVFEYQKLPGSEDVQPLAPAAMRNVHVYEKLGRGRITPEQPGDPRYKDRRMLALYFDMTSMPQADQLRALDAGQRFVRTQMSGADMVAILRYEGGSVQVLQDFTTDRDRLLSILETMMVGEGQGFGESADDTSGPDTGAAFGQDDSEFNIFNTDRQLAALQTAAKLLGQLSEKKALIYFASGLRLNGLNNQAQLRATINSAIRAGVSFWPVDARGLVAQPPLGDATQGSPGNSAMYSGAGALAMTTAFQRSQDTLYPLAADTGGKALLDDNNLSKGIVQAARAISSYYVLGYYSTNTALDGKFRRVKIALNNHLSAKLDYRQGYFAGKQFAKFTSADKERQLEDALMLPDPITELTIAMEIDYFQLNRAEYYVPVILKIPGRELALAKHGGADHTTIDFIGEVKDSAGTTMMNVRDKVNAKLTGETAQELAKRPIVYDTGFTLLPGTYSIKVLARDAETGRIGTYQASFTIPNLNKEETRLAISSVVLSSQRVEMKDALYSAKDKENAQASNPLVQDGRKLIPSVTRVFRKDQSLHVYLQAYEQAAASAEPVIAYVTLMRAQEKAMQTGAVQFAPVRESRLKAVPLAFEVPLEQLPPGKYEVQVTALDPNAQKAAFWVAPILVLP